MRTFALLAFLAAYASSAQLESDEGTIDILAEEGDAIGDALEGITEDIDEDLPGDEEGEGLDGGDDEAIEDGISNEDLAASIDGALAQADENGQKT